MTSITKTDRNARLAVSALFLTNGALFANLLPRYPQIKDSLALENSEYGLAIAAFPVGAIAAGLAAAMLVRRFGSGLVAAVGTLLTAVAIFGVGLAPNLALFVLLLFLAGCMDSVTDVAQNSHGLRVQRRYRRSIINSFHAIWSVGALLGGSMAAAAIALDLPLGIHLGISALIFSIISIAAYKNTLPHPDSDLVRRSGSGGDDTDPATPAGAGSRTMLMVIALVMIAIAGTVVEDSGNSWAALYLSADLGAAGSVAAFGFISLIGAQFIGRITGDRLVDAFGQRLVARSGGALTAIGMGVALAFPSIPGTLIGFACAGFGTATVVPAAMDAADKLPGLKPGTGLTLVSWLMRLGFLLSPPIVGFIADQAGLRAGLLIVPFVGAMVVVLAGVLQGKRVT